MAFPALSPELVERLDVPGPRYTSYPTVPVWSDAFGADDFAAALREASSDTDPIGVYVHIPFCKDRCTFCGCNVVIASDPARADEYLDHLEREIAMIAPYLGGRHVSQMHWGGGTPTFLTERQIDRLVAMLRTRFFFDIDAEISIEIDPVVTTDGQLDLLRKLGFNRISLGVQDFDERVQHAVNRPQSVDITRHHTDHARAIGFDSVNFDLINGLPFQTKSTWSQTIDTVRELRPDRLAIYSFAFVPDARPHQKRLPVLAMPQGMDKLALFALAYERLLESGYVPIGMDHFALPEDELARALQHRTLTRNFQGYAARTPRDVIAFGVTAISDIRGRYAQNHPQIAKYYQKTESGRFATARGIKSSAEDRTRRKIITSLMCNFWVDLGEYAQNDFAQELAQLQHLEDEGLLHLDDGEIELTPIGRLFVRNVAMVFDQHLGQTEATFSRTV